MIPRSVPYAAAVAAAVALPYPSPLFHLIAVAVVGALAIVAGVLFADSEEPNKRLKSLIKAMRRSPPGPT